MCAAAHRSALLRGCCALASLCVSPIVFGQTPLAREVVASGLSNPIGVTHAPGDPTRLFIVEQGGRIKVVHNGSLLATPFLDGWYLYADASTNKAWALLYNGASVTSVRELTSQLSIGGLPASFGEDVAGEL